MHMGHRSAVLCLLLTLLGFVLTLHRTANDFINLTGNSDFLLVNMSQELSRSRAACRGWVTRECKNLATTFEDPELNVVKLSAAMDEFDKRLTNLDDVQSRYELSLEDEDAILNDITTAADFLDSARKVRTLAAEKFKELSGDSDNKSAAHISSFSMTDVKLPKLNLPVFNGDVLQWQSFWDQFVAAVDSTDLPDVSKFSYLRASLEGEPKAAIQGLSLTSAHYASACKILKDRFGRKETIIFSHIQKLLNLSVPSKCSVSEIEWWFTGTHPFFSDSWDWWWQIWGHSHSSYFEPRATGVETRVVTWWQGAWKWPQVFAIFSWERNSTERKVTNVSGVFGAKV